MKPGIKYIYLLNCACCYAGGLLKKWTMEGWGQPTPTIHDTELLCRKF